MGLLSHVSWLIIFFMIIQNHEQCRIYSRSFSLSLRRMGRDPEDRHSGFEKSSTNIQASNKNIQVSELDIQASNEDIQVSHFDIQASQLAIPLQKDI